MSFNSFMVTKRSHKDHDDREAPCGDLWGAYDDFMLVQNMMQIEG